MQKIIVCFRFQKIIHVPCQCGFSLAHYSLNRSLLNTVHMWRGRYKNHCFNCFQAIMKIFSCRFLMSSIMLVGYRFICRQKAKFRNNKLKGLFINNVGRSVFRSVCFKFPKWAGSLQLHAPIGGLFMVRISWEFRF